MRFPTERKTQIGFAFALACLAVIAAVSWVVLQRLRENAEWVEHTHTVVARLEGLFANVIAAQNSYRGYLFTGDESYLEPYREAVVSVPIQLRQARHLLRDNPAQQQRLHRVNDIAASLLARGHELIALRQAQGVNAFRGGSLGGQGKRLHDDFRRLIDEMKAHELTLLRSRELQTRRTARVAQVVIVGMGVLGFLFVGLASLAIRRDFAGRQRAEAELERFFSLSLDFLCIASADGYFKRVSPAVTDILGWSVEEFLAKPFMDFVHPDDWDATLREVERQVVAGAKVQHFENRYRHKDGSWRVLSWRSIPQPNGLMYATARDVTELKRAEMALREAHDRLEDRVRERTAALRATTESLQREVAEREEAQARVQTQLARLELFNQITRAVGERHDMRSIFQVVVRTLEEQLPADFCCIALRQVANDALDVRSVGRATEPLARKLGLLEEGSIPLDESGLLKCILGTSVYEPDISSLPFSFPRRLSQVGLRALVASPLRVESQVFGALIVARRRPDSFASADCEFLRQLSEHVALAARQAQLHDSLQKAYDELRQTQEVVMQQERLRALGQMASGIAHDINNAISPVMLYTESLLEKAENLTPEARGQLETIQRAIDDVAQTVARMREFYRKREPQVTLAPVNLNNLVTQVLDLTHARWSDMAHKRGISIDVQSEFASDLPAIRGAESELREALTNLIFNALDAMPRGGRLTLRSSAQDRGVVIEVIDTGIGMDEETRRRCLEPFFTTKGERGTGLGLAMVYGVVQRHGAEMEIESALQVGTTVRLIFPIPRPSAAEAPRSMVPARPPAGLRILLVDDDPILLKSLSDILAADGHFPVTANGGEAGIETFRVAQASTEPFDLVITDLGMPQVDGRKVAAAIKASAATVPVLLLTGWGQRMISEGEKPPHVDRVMAKPPKLQDLRAAMAAVLTRNGPA